jgi:SAM-dependent methyltransferase
VTPKETAVFFEIHSGLPRQGPGSRNSTRRAYSCLRGLPESPGILDAGCGPGAQTLELAALSGGEIFAVDNHRPFIEGLQAAVSQQGLEERVFPLVADMHRLPFEEERFDLIWAEGSIYIIGLERGLTEWRKYLKSPGFMAFSHVAWLRNDPPQELADFWQKAYPAIGTREDNARLIASAGYQLLDSFVLPESDWWDPYYRPIEKKLPSLKARYRDDPEALSVLQAEETEIDLYRRYSAWYGYVFYITRNATA